MIPEGRNCPFIEIIFLAEINPSLEKGYMESGKIDGR